MVTKLDRLARSLRDPADIVEDFEADLIRAHTHKALPVAKEQGKQPKLSKNQESHSATLHHAGTHMTAELAELSPVAGSTH